MSDPKSAVPVEDPKSGVPTQVVPATQIVAGGGDPATVTGSDVVPAAAATSVGVSDATGNGGPAVPDGNVSRFYRVMHNIASTLRLKNFPTWQEFKDGAYKKVPSQTIFKKMGFKSIGQRLTDGRDWVGSKNEELSKWIGFKDLTVTALAKLGAKAVAAVGVTALAVKAARSDSVRDAAGDAASAVSSAAGALKQKVMGAPASDRADDEGLVEGGQAAVREKKSPTIKRKSLIARAKARVHRSDTYKDLGAQEKNALQKGAVKKKNGRKSTHKGRKSTKGRKPATVGGRKGRPSRRNCDC